MSRESYPNLIDNLAIVKGETYRKLIESGGITFPGDLTTATLRGQIRDNYVEKGGVLLGTFSFEDSTYDAEGDITRIYPYLTEFATVNLPATLKYVEGREPNIKTNPVYDIELFINDEIIKKKPAFLQIVGEVTGGEVTFNPAEEWTAGIASVELIATVGFTKTYQIWGDEAKTVSLGTFDVIDTQPAEGISGFTPNLTVTQEGTWIVDTELDLTPLATEDTLTNLSNKVDELVVIDGKLQVDANVSLPNVYDVQLDANGIIQLEELTLKVVEQNPLSFDGLATEFNQTILNGKIPDGLTVTGGKLLVDAAVELPTVYGIEGVVELGETSLTALENISATVDTTGLATSINQVSTNTKLDTISDKLPANLTVVDNKLQVNADITLPETYTVTGTVRNNPVTASTPTLTNVASSATSVTLLAANSDRKTVVIVNDSTATLYVKFDASAASTTSYTLKLPPSVNNIPAFTTFSGSDYVGEIRGIWSSANGFARITEVV